MISSDILKLHSGISQMMIYWERWPEANECFQHDRHGGFLSHGGTPKSSTSDIFSIETYDLKKTYWKKPLIVVWK